MLTITYQDQALLRTVELVCPWNTIGRGPDCTIRVIDPTLSRLHAAVVRAGQVWTLVDQGSSSGAFVNGRKANNVALVDGDVFHLGRVSFRVGQTAPRPEDERQMVALLQRGSEALRDVFADWLEGQGRLEHAEYVRAELLLQRSPTAERSARLARLAVLSVSVNANFRAEVSRLKIEECFSSSCPREWTKLELTAEPRERGCSACGRKVLFCDNVREAAGCPDDVGVCVDVSRDRSPGDLRRPRIVVG